MGDAIVLETAFAGGGHLNATGQASSIADFTQPGFEYISALVFVSHRETTAGPSGQWEVQRTEGRFLQAKEEKVPESP